VLSFRAPESALVTRRLTSTGDETGYETSRWVVRAGAPGTHRPVLVDCRVDDYAREAPAALDGTGWPTIPIRATRSRASS
jgi:hypothetical protein